MIRSRSDRLRHALEMRMWLVRAWGKHPNVQTSEWQGKMPGFVSDQLTGRLRRLASHRRDIEHFLDSSEPATNLLHAVGAQANEALPHEDFLDLLQVRASRDG